MVRWADLVSGFFGTYSGMLSQSGSGDSSVLIGIFYTNLTFQDRTPSPLPSPVLFFSCRLEASARGRWHRAGLLWRRGDYYLGCGRRRYCGRVCCLSRRRVLALAAMLLAVSRSPSSIPPTESLPGAMPPSSGVPPLHPQQKKTAPGRSNTARHRNQNTRQTDIYNI